MSTQNAETPKPRHQVRVHSRGASEVLRVGRYRVEDRFAAGGMATVHIGRLQGAAGFSRTVAIKRLLPQFACDPEFRDKFIQEAHLVARINHPNVVATLDAVADDDELILVMEYVAGETFGRLMQTAAQTEGSIPEPIVLRIVRDGLAGLHAAHEARDRFGKPLHIVHRDISPHNLIVGEDGIARVLDFGIAKAATSVDTTREGVVRGKAAYMAPEQLLGKALSCRTDVYAMGVVLWEGLACERLFPGAVRPELLAKVEGDVPPPSQSGAATTPELDALVMKALEKEPADRFQSAAEMASALERNFRLATADEVARWVQATAAEGLVSRQALVSRVESAHCSIPPASTARDAVVVTATFEDADALSHPPQVGQSSHGRSGRKRRLALWGGATLLAGSLISVSWAIGAATQKAAADPAPSVAVDRAAPAPVAAAAEAPASDPSAQRLPPEAGHATAPQGTTVASTPTSTPSQPRRTQAPPKSAHDQSSGSQHTPRRASPRASQNETTAAADATRTTRKRRKTKRRSRNNCSPPYTVDGAGRRHYKAECF